MKHLLNNLTEQEKNSIREQHTGGMKVMNENFDKLINAKLGDVKTLVEAVAAPEPVVTSSRTAKVFFEQEGMYELSDDTKERIREFITPALTKSKKTIEKFYRDKTFKLPKFVTIGASTTSGGSPQANDKVAQGRISVVKAVVEGIMKEIGYTDEMIRLFLTTNTDYYYNPTELDSNLYDRNRVKPLDKERFVYITLKSLDTAGLDSKGIDVVEDMMKIARGYNINPDEQGIADAICRLQTYSDIKDLDNELRDFGGLEMFINQTITNGFTTYDSDIEERRQIVDCLNRAAKTSAGGRIIAKRVGDKVSIMLN